MTQDRKAFHLAEYKRACEELDPSIRWWTDIIAPPTVAAGCGAGTIAYRRTGQYEGDGRYEAGGENVFGGKSLWNVKLLPSMKDGQRTFSVSCPGENMVLTEERLDTFIGKRLP